MISIVTIQQVLRTLPKQLSILIRLTMPKRQSLWRSREKRPSNLSTKTTLLRWRFRNLRCKKKRDVKPYNTKQKCPRDELSIRYNLICKETNKRCSTRSRWPSSRDKLMSKVCRGKSRWGETPWNTNISLRPL